MNRNFTVTFDLLHPCWLKVLISYLKKKKKRKKNLMTLDFWMIADIFIQATYK